MRFSEVFRRAAAAIVVFVSAAGGSAEPLRVVATLSTYADLAETVGGDAVKVDHVAPPKFNPHFIEPRPSDVLKVKRADLFIHGGLDLEAWRGPLVDAAGNPRVRPGGDRELPLSTGIPLLQVPERLSRAEGDIHIHGNPHYWVDPRNAIRMVGTITEKLVEIAPEQAEAFRKRSHAFTVELQLRMEEWRERLRPYAGRELVGYHDEWPYLIQFAGLRMEQFLEPKPGIPPSPQHLLRMEQYVRERRIPALVQASFMPDRPARKLARDTGIRVVFLGQNVGEFPKTDSYIALMEYNVTQLIQALAEADGPE